MSNAFYYHSITGPDLGELAWALASEPWAEDMEDEPELFTGDVDEIGFCGAPDVEDEVREILKAFSKENRMRINYVVSDADGGRDASAMVYTDGRETVLDTDGFHFVTFDGAKVISDAITLVPGSFRSLVLHFIGLCRDAEEDGWSYEDARELAGLVTLLEEADADRYGELVGTDSADLLSVLSGLDSGEVRDHLEDRFEDGTMARLMASAEARTLDGTVSVTVKAIKRKI